MAEQGYSRFYSFIFCIWNYWLCRFTSPDIDHISINLDEGEGMRFLEKIPIIGWILRALWLSYTTFYAGIMLALGGHRSFFSHSLIVGTGGRIIFFSFPFWMFLYFIEIRNGNIWNWENVYNKFNMQYWLIPLYFSQSIMWTIGDAIHLLLDTEFVKNVLYVPETSKRKDIQNFKPSYNKFIGIIISIAVGYIINKITGIKNLKNEAIKNGRKKGNYS